jgi:hypothetical protein
MSVDLGHLDMLATTARVALNDALLARYPRGQAVAVYLSAKQMRPTPSKVVGLGTAQGTIRVRLDSAKPGSRRPCRDIHYSRVAS